MRAKLIELLVGHSYDKADYPKYELSSGQRSDTYIDCKATMMLAEAAPLIGAVCEEFIPSSADSVGGLTLGADPIAHAISSYFWYVRQRAINVFAVRKTPKAHGLGKFIEGGHPHRVVVVDDVVTTGGSTIEAIGRCREAGLQVLSVVVLVDREESGGFSAVQRAAGDSVPVHSIFKKSELAALWDRQRDTDGRRAATGY